MFKARATGNIANGMITGVPVPASFVGFTGDANAVVGIRDGGAGSYICKYDQTTFNGQRPFVMCTWPVYCASGIHANVSGGNVTVFYV